MPTGLIAILVLFLHVPPVAADLSGTKAAETIEQSIQMQQQAQKEADAWGSEREELLTRIRNLKNELRYLRYQQAKYQSHAEKQEENIRRAEAKKEQLEKIQMELEPYLNKAVRRLQELVQNDLPFLPEERQKRLSFLQESLEDYHLPASEKYRRVLEALQVEAEYGKYPEADETLLELNGEPTKVHLLRLGRLALYYLSLDGQKAGRFDRNKGQWEQLSADCAGELKSAMQMIGKSRTMELVNLPIGR